MRCFVREPSQRRSKESSYETDQGTIVSRAACFYMDPYDSYSEKKRATSRYNNGSTSEINDTSWQTGETSIQSSGLDKCGFSSFTAVHPEKEGEIEVADHSLPIIDFRTFFSDTKKALKNPCGPKSARSSNKSNRSEKRELREFKQKKLAVLTRAIHAAKRDKVETAALKQAILVAIVNYLEQTDKDGDNSDSIADIKNLDDESVIILFGRVVSNALESYNDYGQNEAVDFVSRVLTSPDMKSLTLEALETAVLFLAMSMEYHEDWRGWLNENGEDMLTLTTARKPGLERVSEIGLRDVPTTEIISRPDTKRHADSDFEAPHLVPESRDAPDAIRSDSASSSHNRSQFPSGAVVVQSSHSSYPQHSIPSKASMKNQEQSPEANDVDNSQGIRHRNSPTGELRYANSPTHRSFTPVRVSAAGARHDRRIPDLSSHQEPSDFQSLPPVKGANQAIQHAPEIYAEEIQADPAHRRGFKPTRTPKSLSRPRSLPFHGEGENRHDSTSYCSSRPSETSRSSSRRRNIMALKQSRPFSEYPGETRRQTHPEVWRPEATSLKGLMSRFALRRDLTPSRGSSRSDEPLSVTGRDDSFKPKRSSFHSSFRRTGPAQESRESCEYPEVSYPIEPRRSLLPSRSRSRTPSRSGSRSSVHQTMAGIEETSPAWRNQQGTKVQRSFLALPRALTPRRGGARSVERFRFDGKCQETQYPRRTASSSSSRQSRTPSKESDYVYERDRRGDLDSGTQDRTTSHPQRSRKTTPVRRIRHDLSKLDMTERASSYSNTEDEAKRRTWSSSNRSRRNSQAPVIIENMSALNCFTKSHRRQTYNHVDLTPKRSSHRQVQERISDVPPHEEMLLGKARSYSEDCSITRSEASRRVTFDLDKTKPTPERQAWSRVRKSQRPVLE